VSTVDLRISGPLAADPVRAGEILARARKDWLLPAGAVFTQAAWEQAKKSALATVAEHLFAAARIEASEARIDPDQRSAALALTIDSGAALRFGALRIDGTARHSEDRVTSLATFAPGDPYDRERLERFQRRLVATGYFASVHVDADASAAQGDAVPVRVSLIEGPRRRFEFGLGYSTDTGVRGSVDWRNNDTIERDWRTRVYANFETLQQYAGVALELPERPSGWGDSVGLRATRTDIENLATDEVTLALRRTGVDERSRPAFGAALIASRETPLGSDTEHVHATYLDYTHTWRMTDNLLSPRRGWAAQIELGAGVPGVSTRGFGRALGRTTWYVPYGTVNDFAVRAEAGAVLAPSSEGIPQSLLFRTGGSTSVRGYTFDSLGVAKGEAVVGGRYFAMLSGEYTRWVWENIGLALFADAGNAKDELTRWRFALGYGAGVRVRSPIGPFRLDLAYGQEDRKVRIHFSAGLAF
jgi:translocation and assembly module TamA